MHFYSIIWKIIIICSAVFGFIVLLNDKQSLSIFRTVGFGFFPILISIAFFILRKKTIVVIICTNSFLIVFVLLTIFEIYLNYSIDTDNKITNDINLVNKKFCGNSFKKKDNLSIYPLIHY